MRSTRFHALHMNLTDGFFDANFNTLPVNRTKDTKLDIENEFIKND